MKIAYIISSCSSGGAELLVKRLCEAIKMADSTVQIQIWAMCRAADSYENCQQSVLDFESRYISDMKKSGVTVRFLDKRKNRDRLTVLYRIKKFYKDFTPDIVHAHSEICAVYMTAALIGKKTVRIQTIHSSKIFHPKLFKYYLSSNMSSFVSISDEVSVNMLKASIPQRKTVVIKNGIELEKYSNLERSFHGKPVKIIAVGRLAKEKDYPFLLRAFKRAIESIHEHGNESPHLDIVGTGEQYDEIIQIIHNLELDKYVSMLGLRSDVPELLKQSDIYVMSSSFEGLSLALIEAAASGLPIIATDVGSNKKLVASDKNGFLVPHGDVEAFSKAIVELTANENLRAGFSSGSCDLAVSYDIKQTAKEHLDLYGVLSEK